MQEFALVPLRKLYAMAVKTGRILQSNEINTCKYHNFYQKDWTWLVDLVSVGIKKIINIAGQEKIQID